MDEIKISIKGIPPSNNKYMGKYIKPYIYSEDKKRWENKILLAVTPFIPKYPFLKSEITIFYRFKDNRKRDPDNYCGKFLLDGLRKAGVIEDDSFKHIKLILEADFKQVVYDTTIITINNVTEGEIYNELV